MCYEALLISGLLAVTVLLPHTLIGHFLHRLAIPLLLWAHVFLVLSAYFVWFWTHGGQTPAMRTWRIRLTTSDGNPLKLSHALLRFLFCWPSLCLGGLGIVWAVLDKDKQFLHDRIAGTRIVFR